MELRSCSRCNYWSENIKSNVDGVIASVCDKVLIPNKVLSYDHRITKGSDVCGQWRKIKFKMIMTMMGWTKVRDYD